MIPKQDRQGVRTPADLEQKYDFPKTAGAATNAIQAANEAKRAASEAANVADSARETAAEAKRIVEALTAPRDYIVDCGDNGGWYYEKWASGKAVCWKTTDKASEAYSEELVGGGYGLTKQISFIPNFFIAAPSFACVNSIFTAGTLSEKIQSISKDEIQFISVVNVVKAVTVEVQFVIEARGLWKERDS